MFTEAKQEMGRMEAERIRLLREVNIEIVIIFGKGVLLHPLRRTPIQVIYLWQEGHF